MSQYSLTALRPIDPTSENTEHAHSPAGGDMLLLERFQNGEDAAFVELFDRHHQRLFIYCLKMVGEREQAEDLTQELWERVLRLRASPQKILNPVGFFLKIARNLSINHLKARRHHVPLTSLPEGLHPAEREGGRSELEERILTSLELLSFEHREVLILNIYCGYRMEEIAVMLGKSPEAIWKRASRARTQLRRMVTKG
ncbi:MAG: RNA polymerase sigma factor [Candidatus Kapaibacterium sp.]